MDNRCTLTVKAKEVEFVFDNNSLYEFCDCVRIDISGFETYVQTHPGTFMRSLFFAAAKVAAKYKGEQLHIETIEGIPVVLSELDFGLLMSNFTEKDYSKLIKAFEASRPEVKKKKKKRSLLKR